MLLRYSNLLLPSDLYKMLLGSRLYVAPLIEGYSVFGQSMVVNVLRNLEEYRP